MGDVVLDLPGGSKLTLVQAVVLARHLDEMGSENCHWHMNECKCCITLHGPDCAYVIGPDGGETFFAGRGCECE